MILQALYDYAQRKGNELPEEGFENIPIKYLIKIKEDGSLVDVVSTEGEDKKAHVFEKVPMRVARSGKIPVPSLLLDNTEYVISDKHKRESFVKQIETLPEEIRKSKEINAVMLFYRNNHHILLCNIRLKACILAHNKERAFIQHIRQVRCLHNHLKCII